MPIVRMITNRQLNKKLWSFNFGCILAYIFLRLVGIGDSVPVPELLHAYPTFILDYYPGLISASFALVITVLVIWLMNRGFNLCASEHTFWLMSPSLCLLVLTAVSAFNSLTAMLFAVMPSLLALFTIAVFYRLSEQKLMVTKKCAN